MSTKFQVGKALMARAEEWTTRLSETGTDLDRVRR